MSDAITRGKIIRMKRITRAYIRQHRNMVFVFGDNMARTGLGGQAKECRGEPNAIGIPTKWEPARHHGAYFSDENWLEGSPCHKAVTTAIEQIERAIFDGYDVVFPQDGVGTGLAELPTRAPAIHRYIEDSIALLEMAR